MLKDRKRCATAPSAKIGNNMNTDVAEQFRTTLDGVRLGTSLKSIPLHNTFLPHQVYNYDSKMWSFFVVIQLHALHIIQEWKTCKNVILFTKNTYIKKRDQNYFCCRRAPIFEKLVLVKYHCVTNVDNIERTLIQNTQLRNNCKPRKIAAIQVICQQVLVDRKSILFSCGNDLQKNLI